MAEETITILKVDTGQAVKNIADLKNNIKALKEGFEDAEGVWHDGLNNLEIGTDDYKKTLEELTINQNAVKDAMYATSSSLEDVIAGAKGATTSYNSLVHTMAELKREFRATTDAQRQIDLADQINNINNELKRLDALQGNFQRNVGNYQSAFKGLSENIDIFGKSTKLANLGIGDMKDGFEALSKSPMIATFGILVSVLMNVADKIKENEGVMNSLKKVMTAFKPVMDLFGGILEKVASTIADIIDKVVPFITSNGLLDKVVDGVVGVGNAILKFVVAPFKGVIEAIKVFKEQGVKGLGDASRAFANEMKNGISFKSNFQAGESIVEGLMSGMKSKTPEAVQTAKEIGKEIGEELAYDIRAEFDKALAEANKSFEEELQERIADQRFADEMMEEENERFNAELEEFFAEQDRLAEESKNKQEAIAQAKVATMQSVVNATSGILGAIADMYESDEKNSERSAKKVKALRIASAIVDTISGAVGAFTQASETIPPPYGQIVGATNASLVTATGLAQIAKMRSTNVSGSAENASPSAPAIVNAPSLPVDIPSVRSVTSASEEDRLNQMASDQRVVLVMSDLEVKSNQSRVQVAEASF